MECEKIDELNEAQWKILLQMKGRAIAASGSEGSTRLFHIQNLYDQYLTTGETDAIVLNDLGVLFGEFIKRLLGWEWFVVGNSFGKEFSLVYFAEDGRIFVTHPINMISSRLFDSLTVDLKDLLDGILDSYEEEFGRFEFNK